jgi:hypothetical protein
MWTTYRGLALVMGKKAKTLILGHICFA